jgi:hypothetical protein
MQPTQISQADQSRDVEPAIRHVVPWRVASVNTMPDLMFRITFVDGTMGDVDLRNFLRGSQIKGTVFELFRDPKFLHRWGWLWVLCNGPIPFPMPCTMRSKSMAGGLSSEGSLAGKGEYHLGRCLT